MWSCSEDKVGIITNWDTSWCFVMRRYVQKMFPENVFFTSWKKSRKIFSKFILVFTQTVLKNFKNSSFMATFRRLLQKGPTYHSTFHLHGFFQNPHHMVNLHIWNILVHWYIVALSGMVFQKYTRQRLHKHHWWNFGNTLHHRVDIHIYGCRQCWSNLALPHRHLIEDIHRHLWKMNRGVNWL